MSLEEDAGDVTAAIRRLNRRIRQSAAEEGLFREMLEICANQTDLLNERRRTREAVIDAWIRTYRRIADEYLETQSFESSIEVDQNLRPSERIRRLDEEAHDLAILASELVWFLSKEVEPPNSRDSDKDDDSLKTARDSVESQYLPPGYVNFVVVDERGRPTGPEGPSVAEIEQRGAHYITLAPASSGLSPVQTVAWTRENASREQLDEWSSDDDMRTAIGYNTQARAHRISAPYHGTPATRSDDGGRRWRTVRPARSKRSGRVAKTPSGSARNRGQTAGATAAQGDLVSVPAYSMLTDQNKFILVPVLNFDDEKENRSGAHLGVRLSDAQRLWQAELDASSGCFVRYSMLSSSVSGQPRALVDQEAATMADLRTETVFAANDTGRLRRNVRRSLLHRVLGGLRCQSKGICDDETK